jgi:hypothetical protein
VSLAPRVYTSIADGANTGKITHHPPTLIRVESAYIIFSWVPAVSYFIRLFLALKIENQLSTLHTKLLLYKYIFWGGIIKNKRSTLYRINGIENDIHIMFDLHPSICLSDFVKEIKVASSLWLKASENFLAFEGWQDR